MPDSERKAASRSHLRRWLQLCSVRQRLCFCVSEQTTQQARSTKGNRRRLTQRQRQLAHCTLAWQTDTCTELRDYTHSARDAGPTTLLCTSYQYSAGSQHSTLRLLTIRARCAPSALGQPRPLETGCLAHAWYSVTEQFTPKTLCVLCAGHQTKIHDFCMYRPSIQP